MDVKSILTACTAPTRSLDFCTHFHLHVLTPTGTNNCMLNNCGKNLFIHSQTSTVPLIRVTLTVTNGLMQFIGSYSSVVYWPGDIAWDEITKVHCSWTVMYIKLYNRWYIRQYSCLATQYDVKQYGAIILVQLGSGNGFCLMAPSHCQKHDWLIITEFKR